MFIIFIGAMIAVIGTLIAAYGTLEQNKASSKKTAIQIQKLQELTSKNEQLSRQLSETSDEIKNNITGGDNYCTFTLKYKDDSTSILILANIGKSPIYDVMYRIIDMDGIAHVNEKKGITNETDRANEILYAKYLHEGKLGNLSGELAMPGGLIPFGLTGKLRRFTANIYARNGAFVQEAIYSKVNNEWVYAHRTYRQMHKDKILGHYTDPKFPLEQLRW